MKCLYVIQPGPRATEEELEQLAGMVVVKAYEIDGTWKVNPPALIKWTTAALDCDGRRVEAGSVGEILVPTSWLIPIDCSRTKEVEIHSNTYTRA